MVGRVVLQRNLQVRTSEAWPSGPLELTDFTDSEYLKACDFKCWIPADFPPTAASYPQVISGKEDITSATAAKAGKGVRDC